MEMCLKSSPAPVTDFASSGIPLVISWYHFVGLEGHQRSTLSCVESSYVVGSSVEKLLFEFVRFSNGLQTVRKVRKQLKVSV